MSKGEQGGRSNRFRKAATALSGISLKYIVGLALFGAWALMVIEGFLYLTTSPSANDDLLGWVVPPAFSMLAALAMLKIKRKPTIDMLIAAISIVFAVMSMVAMYVIAAHTPHPLIAQVCGMGLSGVAFTTLLIMWIDILAKTKPMTAFLNFFLGLAVSCCIAALLCAVSQEANFLCSLACVLMSGCAMFLILCNAYKHTDNACEENNESKASHYGSYFKRACVVLFAAGLAYYCTDTYCIAFGFFSSDSSFPAIFLVGAVLSLAVAAVALRDAGAVNRVMISAILACMLIGCVCVPFGYAYAALPDFLLLCGNFAVFACLATVCMEFSQNGQQPIRPLAAIGAASIASGRFVGGLGAWVFADALLLDEAWYGIPMLILTLVLVVAFFVALPLLRPHGLQNADSSPTVVASDLGEAGDALFASRDRLAALADKYALSRRESEVFALLARGHGAKRIAQDLYISQGTVSTHRSHIYKKMNISSKQELRDLIERECAAAPSAPQQAIARNNGSDIGC